MHHLAHAIFESAFEMHIPRISDSAACRPKDLLVNFSKLHPGLWQAMDKAREAWKGNSHIPAWTFSTQECDVQAFLGYSRAHDMPTAIAAHILYSWRATQGVYKLHEDLFNALLTTELSGAVPCEVLKKIPEWCLYVETPSLPYVNSSGSTGTAHGFFVLLDPDRETGEPWIFFFIDGTISYEMAAMKLVDGLSIDECIAETIRIVTARNPNHSGIASPTAAANMACLLAPFLNITLFICSQAGELSDADGRLPTLPLEKKTKRGYRVFPPDCQRNWNVGFRIGAALRLSQGAQSHDNASSGNIIRPHIRRAHWHGYWHGPRDGERHFKLKWLPPVAVMVESVDWLPAVSREVS